MKFIVKILLIGGLCYAGLLFMPWWVSVIVPAVVSLILKTKGSGSFFSGFIGVGAAWFIGSYSLYLKGAQEFAGKMAKLFFLPDNGLLLILCTTLIMGLVGALAGYSGNALRNIFISPKKKNTNKYGRPDYSNYSR